MIHGRNSTVPGSSTLKASDPNVLSRCFRQTHSGFFDRINVGLGMFWIDDDKAPPNSFRLRLGRLLNDTPARFQRRVDPCLSAGSVHVHFSMAQCGSGRFERGGSSQVRPGLSFLPAIFRSVNHGLTQDSHLYCAHINVSNITARLVAEAVWSGIRPIKPSEPVSLNGRGGSEPSRHR
jgi:hypothetical protein